MLEFVRSLLISSVYAQTGPESFTNYLIAQFYTVFWTPFGAWAIFALGIAVAMMIWRRIRGTARRPG